MAEPKSPWEKIEEMPEFQAKTPTEKLAYADAYVERMSAQLAPKLAGRPDAQEAFRSRVKDFIFTVADKHFPSAWESVPSQLAESLAKDDQALFKKSAQTNTEIGKQAATTLAGLEGKPDDEILKGNPNTFRTLSPNQDTTVGEYRSYLQSVIEAQSAKGAKNAQALLDSSAESQSRTPSAAMLKLRLSEGWAGWDELIAKSEDPIDTAVAAIAGTMLESSLQSARGAIAGAAATAATGNPLVGGAVMGGVAGESEYQATYLGELQSELQKRGKSDAATIQEILRDDEFNARVDKKAMTRGVTIGAAEGISGYLSFGLANKIGGSSVKKALIGVGAEAGIGAVGGSGGEFLARLFSGEDVWTPEARKDIISEGVAELGQAGTGTATVAFRQFLNQQSQQDAAAQSPIEPLNQPAEISKLEEFSNPNEFYRVVVGDEAFQDIVDTGTVRAKPTIEQTPTPGQISLRARPTAFPSFSQGEVLSGYTESNPNHFVIATSDPSIKPSESGRHGKGKTMFPTDQDGNPTSSLDASKVRVYRHVGDGNYQLVYQNGKRINEESTISQVPEVDDAPVRSVLEEFSDEADATEVPSPDVPAVAPISESPVPVSEPETLTTDEEGIPQSTTGLREIKRAEGEGFTAVQYEFTGGSAAVRIRNDGTAFVGDIQIGEAADKTRGKGLGTQVYQEIGESLAAEGIALESTRWSRDGNAISPAALRVWEKLASKGMARVTGRETGKVLDRFSGEESVQEYNTYEFVSVSASQNQASARSQPEPVYVFDIDEGLRVEVTRNPDGTASVEKINTETGVTIPLEGAAAPFENPKAALDFLSSTFARNLDGDIVSEAAASNPESIAKGEQDPLLSFLRSNKILPAQTDIRTIGRVSRKESKGFRGTERDTSSRSDYEGVPLIRDYENNPTAQERLRGIYSRETGRRPDQVAKDAFADLGPSVLKDDSVETLFQAIKDRLDGDSGRVSQVRDSDAGIADMVAERASQVENDFEAFYRAIKSPYRRGGVVPARQFLPGDVLQVGTDAVEVTDANEDTVTFRSRERGIFELAADETVGFDSMEENGVPASERETIPQEDRVSREDAVALTAFIRERLNLRGGNSQATVVPSREHSALAKNVSELNAARRISRFFDSTVVGVSSFPAQGAISRKQVQEAQANGGRKVVFLATDASRVEAVLVMHEMLHTMAVTDQDLYNELLVAMGVVFDKDGNLPRDENGKRILGADLEEYISRVRPEHESLSDEMLVEEYLADLLAERAGTKEFWQGLALRDPSAFERIANFVLDFLRQVADRIRNDRVKVERFLRDQAAMRNAIEEVMVAFRARQSQDRAGILDVPLDESMPFADVRFADRRTKPNQDIFGQKTGRSDEVQSMDEVLGVVKREYFDGDAPITQESRDMAIFLINEMTKASFDASRETGLDAAGGALIVELWKFAKRLDRQGDSSLIERMTQEKNDYNNREVTKSARIVNSQGWHSSAIEVADGEIAKAKRAVVNEETGDKNTADILAEMEREISALKVTIEQLNKEKSEKFDAFVQAKAGLGAAEETATLTKQLTGGKKGGERTKKAVDKFANFLRDTFGSDIRFADERLSEQDRELQVVKWVREQATSRHKKKAVFVRNLMEFGRTREFAEEMFLRAAEFRAEIAESLKADQAEAKSQAPAKTVAERIAEATNAESVRIDKLNRKSDKLSDRYTNGPKKRKASDKEKGEWESTVERLIGQGANYNRENAAKELLRIGVENHHASRLATAIEAKIKNDAAKGEKATPAEKAREIIARYKSPINASRQSRSPVRILINTALKKGSTTTEASFIEDARNIGIPTNEAADLWTDIVELRRIQDDLRKSLESERKAKREAKADQELAKRLIDRLENPKDPASPRTKRTTERIFEDMFKPDRPTRTRNEFVGALAKVGVDAATASQLYDLAIKEKSRLESEAKMAAAKRFITKSAVNAIKKEILAHPSLKIVGPAERLQIMARVIQERAGLTAVDAMAAAKQFDEMLVEQWEVAALEIADEVATRRNAPYFRKDPSGKPSKKKSAFDNLREAIRSGALDPTKRILTEVAKANGWVDLTEFERSELTRLDALLDDKNLTLLEKTRYETQMLSIYQNSRLPLTVLGVLKNMYIANSFSSPSTMLIGLSGIAEGLVALPRDLTMAITGVSESRNVVGLMTAWGRIPKYISDALRDFAVTFRTGDTRIELADEIRNASSDLDRVWEKHLKRVQNPNTSVVKRSLSLATLFGALGRFTLRVLGAFDSFIRGYMSRYTTELEAFSRAAGLGLKRPQILALIGQVQLNANRYREEAFAKGFTAKSDIESYVTDKTAMSLYAALEGEPIQMPEGEELLESVADTIKGIKKKGGVGVDAIKKRATKEANLATGMGKIEEGWIGLGKVAISAKEWSQGDTLGALLFKIIIPVVQTPYNYFHRSLWFSPYALLRILGTAVQTRGFTKWEKSRYQNSLADPTQLAVRGMEAVLGNVLFGAFAKLVVDQLFEEDEEKRWLRVNLFGPSAQERARRGAWLEDGNRPYSVQMKIFGRWHTYGFRKGGFEIFNAPLTMLGAISQSRYDGDPYWLTLVKQMSGEAFFFMRGPMSRGFKMENLGSELGYRASGFVPVSALLKTPNRFMDMPDRPQGFWENFKMQMPIVPMLSENRPALNSLGQPVRFNETSGTYMQSRLNIPIGSVPVASRNRTASNPGYNDILILLNDKQAFPSQYPKYALDDHLKRSATDDEFYEFQRVRGQMIYDAIKRNYTELWKLDPEQAEKVIKRFTDKATDHAKAAAKAGTLMKLP